MAGNSVKVLNKKGRTIDVQEINNHQITNIPIATVAGIVNTQCGEMILIMHEYTYISNAKTFHSSAQLEADRMKVDVEVLKSGEENA